MAEQRGQDGGDVSPDHDVSEGGADEAATGEDAGATPDARAQRRALARERRAGQDAQPREPDQSAKRPFEFKAEHNPKFARLGTLMQLVGGVDLAMTVVAAAAFLVTVIALPAFSPVLLLYIVPVVVPAAVGVWTIRAGTRFSLIATTRGSDVGHLMTAIGELTKLYLLQVVSFVLGIAAAVIAFVLRATILLP
jgi:hypothetical protein